jgi:predicted metal-dependent enzyme (double-stranded beta helix superfamily)
MSGYSSAREHRFPVIDGGWSDAALRIATSDALADVPRPRRRDLTGPELEAFARELASRPELWIEHVLHDSDQRHYRELLSDQHITAWLICWMEDQDTGFHDHDISSGAVAVVGGQVREDRLAIDSEAPRAKVHCSGETFHFSAADIHRVRHHGKDPSVTLHVYSPPLLRMGSYSVGPTGVLERHPVSYQQELRPA